MLALACSRGPRYWLCVAVTSPAGQFLDSPSLEAPIFREWGDDTERDLLKIRSIWATSGTAQGFPSRGDIDPVRFGRLLGLISLAELLEGDPWIRFRLVCSEAEARVGHSLKGHQISAESPTKGAQTLQVLYRQLTVTEKPVLAEIRLATATGASLACMAAMFPLWSDHNRIDHLLIGTVFRRFPSQQSSDLIKGLKND